MNYARWLRRASVPGLAIAAIAFASYSAQAATYTGSGILFSTQSVAGSVGGGSVTIGIGGGAAGIPIVYLSNGCATAAATTISVTFTLPSGVTYTSNPAAVGAGTFAAAMAQVSGGIGNSFITFTGSAACAAVGATGTVTLGAFNLTGAVQLVVPNTTNFQHTVSLSSPDTGLSAPSTKGQIASSAAPIQLATFASTVAPLVIDIAAPSLGSQFIQGGGADTAVGDQGAVVFIITATQNAADTAAFTPASTANVLLTGNWGGISKPFLLASAGAQATSCPAVAPGTAVVGTVAGNTITFPNATLPTAGAGFLEVCLNSGVTAGKGIIAGNILTAVSTNLPASAVAVFPGFTLTALDAYNYNGAVDQILYSGDFSKTTASGYLFFLRITNNTGNSVSPAVLVQPDTGTAGLNTSITVPANNNVLLPATSVISGSGITLDATGRVSFLVLTPGAACINNAAGAACPVSVNAFLVNPNQTIVFAGSGASP
jgi:hypothetical protein